MPLTIDRDGARSLVRVEGEFNLASAAELKALLLEELAASKGLQVDLAGVTGMDVSLLQLLWAAGQQASGRELPLVSGVSEEARRAAREAGFERFPGTDDAGGNRG